MTEPSMFAAALQALNVESWSSKTFVAERAPSITRSWAVSSRADVHGCPLSHDTVVNRTQRSGGGLLLDVNLERYGRRAFACAGSTL